MDTKTSEVVICARRKGLFSYGYLYKNSLGEPFSGEINTDWKDFKLDRNLFEKIKHLLKIHDLEAIAT